MQYSELRKLTDEMTVRQRLKTVVCPQHHAEGLMLEKGCLSLFLRETTKETVQQFISAYHEDGRPDAIICSDTECGAGEMIEGCESVSSPMAMGRSGDEELAYQAGFAMERQ